MIDWLEMAFERLMAPILTVGGLIYLRAKTKRENAETKKALSETRKADLEAKKAELDIKLKERELSGTEKKPKLKAKQKR